MRGSLKVLLLFLAVLFTLYSTYIFQNGFYIRHLTSSWQNIYGSSNMNDNDNTNNTNIKKVSVTANLSCLAGIVFAQTGGRLGNRLMEYASAWSLAKFYNITPVVHDEIYNRIIPLFTKLSVSPASIFLNELQKKDPDCARLAEKIFLDERYKQFTDGPRSKVKKMISREPLILRRFTILQQTISRLRSEMKKEFTYQPNMTSYAEKTLREATAGLNSTAPGEEVVYVGVHVRRTDYPRYLRLKFGEPHGEYADTDYYVRAMKYMLKRLSEKGNLKVVFAVASDDMEWTEKHLISELENDLKSSNLLGTNATVSWCGSDDPDRDLVLLSSCNHSIISYGTYGSWAALMTGGRTVVFNANHDGKKRNFSGSMLFVNRLSNWIMLR